MAIAFVHPREGVASYAGGKLYFYNPGTATERNVYQDADLTSLHTQPVVADAAGVFPTIYLQSGTFKVRFEQSTGALVYEQDNVDPGVGTGPGALPISSGGTGATNAVTARTNLGAAAATDLTTTQGGLTIVQSQIAASIVGGTRLGFMAAKDTVSATDLDDTNFGIIMAQRHYTALTSGLTTTSTIPVDPSIPQSGEGAELWSVSFTPRFADSKILFRGIFQVGTTNANSIVFALFDGNASAVASNFTIVGSTTIVTNAFTHEFNSWGTTTKTLSVRWGPQSAGTAYLNQPNTGSNYLGNTIPSSIEVVELKGGPF